MGIGLGIIAGWIAAYDPKWGIGIGIVGFILIAWLNISMAGAMQDQIDPAALALSFVGVVISGLITWKIRQRFLAKRGDL